MNAISKKKVTESSYEFKSVIEFSLNLIVSEFLM